MEGQERGEKRESLVERRRQEAFHSVCDVIDGLLQKQIGSAFEVNGRAYELTSAEDCMVAYAQHMRTEVQKLHEEIVKREDYYEEKATAKLLELFKIYERLIGLYAELRSYYPEAARRVEEHIPSLSECALHGEKLWEEAQTHKEP